MVFNMLMDGKMTSIGGLHGDSQDSHRYHLRPAHQHLTQHPMARSGVGNAGCWLS
jgi:hypothetical protein